VRRRLLLSTLAVAFVALLLLGIPMAVIGPALIEDRARDRVAREAERLLAVVALRVEADETVDAARLGLLVQPGRKAVVDLPDGRRITAGAVPGVSAARAAALDLGPWLAIALQARRLCQGRARYQEAQNDDAGDDCLVKSYHG